MSSSEESESGKARGGHARAEALSPEQRREIARKAASARWNGEPELKATHGSEDHPLRIGDIEIPCYVLEDGRRVLQQTGLIRGLNMSHGGSYSMGGDRLAKFTSQGRLKSFVSNELVERTANPIKFRTPRGSLAYGYEATILADLCDAILAARREGVLQKQQAHIADRAEILVRGFARIGIIALVDEATGYQNERARDALAKILEAFIAKELQPWVKTFPSDFYDEMFRLRGLKYPNDSVQRPQYFGVLTNDIVYKRLAPGVLDELKRSSPKTASGRPKGKLFQMLTNNVGYPKLREHLGSVVAIMKLSDQWSDFMNKLDRLHPRYGETIPLPLEYQHDDGKGL
ncbi:P63C domain-containing protein [Microvirga arabica]|uniref:P63C domain-containing protein n=1 Tax=Microvirga arabica TaxID=1128671 RepID=A0ABV6Y3V6_9HYPH